MEGGQREGVGGWILNQRSAPVTPSGVPPSGHVPKNSNGRRFKCKTAGFGAAASLRVWDFYGSSWLPSNACFFPPPPSLPPIFFPSSNVTGRWACISEQAHGPHVSGQCVNIHLPTNIITTGCFPTFLPALLSLCHSQRDSITTPHGTRACAQHQLFQLPPEMTCFRYFSPHILFANYSRRVLFAQVDHYQHYRRDVEYLKKEKKTEKEVTPECLFILALFYERIGDTAVKGNIAVTHRWSFGISTHSFWCDSKIQCTPLLI